MKITMCPPAPATGEVLDDVIFFLRSGVPLSTARLLARAYHDAAFPEEVSDALWEALQAYIVRYACECVSKK